MVANHKQVKNAPPFTRLVARPAPNSSSRGRPTFPKISRLAHQSVDGDSSDRNLQDRLRPVDRSHETTYGQKRKRRRHAPG